MLCLLGVCRAYIVVKTRAMIYLGSMQLHNRAYSSTQLLVHARVNMEGHVPSPVVARGR